MGVGGSTTNQITAFTQIWWHDDNPIHPNHWMIGPRPQDGIDQLFKIMEVTPTAKLFKIRGKNPGNIGKFMEIPYE